MPPRQRKTEEEKRKQRQEQSDAALVALIAGALAVGASAQATATLLAGPVGIPVATLLPILKIALSRPMSYNVSPLGSKTATGESSQLEYSYRAAYVLSASRRLQAASPSTRRETLARERRYFNAHLDATKNRRDVAAQVDKAAQRYGDQLGWYAKMDSRTSAECRKANGKNFTVGKRPEIGYPGAVHPHCRCKAGKPHATSQTVYNIKSESSAA